MGQGWCFVLNEKGLQKDKGREEDAKGWGVGQSLVKVLRGVEKG